jgi:hypothetical protein
LHNKQHLGYFAVWRVPEATKVEVVMSRFVLASALAAPILAGTSLPAEINAVALSPREVSFFFAGPGLLGIRNNTEQDLYVHYVWFIGEKAVERDYRVNAGTSIQVTSEGNGKCTGWSPVNKK